ncbi:hypothetical protein BGZ65_010119, partial [Modicella reniformis]
IALKNPAWATNHEGADSLSTIDEQGRSSVHDSVRVRVLGTQYQAAVLQAPGISPDACVGHSNDKSLPYLLDLDSFSCQDDLETLTTLEASSTAYEAAKDNVKAEIKTRSWLGQQHPSRKVRASGNPPY